MNLNRTDLYDVLRDPAALRLVHGMRLLGPSAKRMLVHTHVLAADYRQNGLKVPEIAGAFAAYAKLFSNEELASELLWQWPEFRPLIGARAGDGDPLPRGGRRLVWKTER